VGQRAIDLGVPPSHPLASGPTAAFSSLHHFGQCPPWSKGLIERQVGGPTERPFMARNGYADAVRFGNNVSKLS
jgi:hypothetical protein